MKKLLLIVLPLFIVVLISSCSKDPGVGGNGSIHGKVYAKYYNKYFTVFLGEGYAADKEVYIIYGDDLDYGDKVNTNYDGSYEFKYLRKGKYKVVTYSKDSTLTVPSGTIAVIQEGEISSNKESVELPDLKIFD
ncbi:MAG: hypothetical protein WCL06_15840 [Bacteroidota bacterium]